MEHNVGECADSVRGRGRGTWQDMLRSPFMWLISVSYFLVFLGRTATLDWAQLYLIQDLGHNQYVGIYIYCCFFVCVIIFHV